MNRSLIFSHIPDMLAPWFPGDKPLLYILDHIAEAIRAIVEANPGRYREIRKNVFAGEHTRIDPCTEFYGPALIGDHCEIRHGAFLRENVITGNGCVVGNSTEIKNSVLFDYVQAPHFNYVGDSILGSKAHLGAGVKLSNVRLDGGPVSIKCPGGEPVPTGRKKFGAIIGEGVQIGCNSVLNPGTVVEKDSVILPLQSIGGYYANTAVRCQAPFYRGGGSSLI